MNQLNKDEMFGNLQNFLKSKGITMQEGTYTQRIRKGCGLLTDSINLSQRAFVRAKGAVDKKLERLRQVIHEQTAPKPPPAPAPAGAAAKNSGAEKRTSAKSRGTRANAATPKRRSRRK